MMASLTAVSALLELHTRATEYVEPSQHFVTSTSEFCRAFPRNSYSAPSLDIEQALFMFRHLGQQRRSIRAH
jgi:hypothetical protein